MNNRDYFNSLADVWDSTVNHDEDKIKHILNLIGIASDSRIMDAGTGTGVLIPYLREHLVDGMITAVDVSDKMIEIARLKHGADKAEYITADITDLECPAGYYDIIICYSMFPHIEDKSLAIRKLSSFLRKGGKLVICHSESLKNINTHHRNINKSDYQPYLPEADEIAALFALAELDTAYIEDNEQVFIIIGER